MLKPRIIVTPQYRRHNFIASTTSTRTTT